MDAGTMDLDGADAVVPQPSDDGGRADAGQTGQQDAEAGQETAPDGGAGFMDFDASMFLCDPAAEWGPGQAVPGLAQEGSAQSLALTPDELSIAWVESTEAGGFSYHVAGRASATDPIGNEQILALDTLATPPGISLSADGLSLAVVKPDQSGFLEAVRSSTSGAFGALAESEFKSLNAWVAVLRAKVADPTFGTDGHSFLYWQSGASVTVYESRRTPNDAGPEVWPVGTPLAGAALSTVTMSSDAGSSTQFRHPTSLSSDGLTLFILDEYPSPTARALYRTALGAPFGASKEIGNWQAVHANASCTALYYIEDGAVQVSQKM